jgi:hypothetical protein
VTWSGYTTCTELELTADELRADEPDPRPYVDEFSIPEWYRPAPSRESLATMNAKRKKKR